MVRIDLTCDVVHLSSPWTWEEVDELANFVLRRQPAYLLTATKQGPMRGSLAKFGPNRHMSERSRINDPSGSRASVLCFGPDWKLLERAMWAMNRRDGLLAVVEWEPWPLGGWASAVGSVDFRTGESAPPLDEATVELAEDLAFAGNNGFESSYGKRDATHLIQRAAAEGTLRWEVVGAMAARGCGERDLNALTRIIEATGFPNIGSSDSGYDWP